jgi:hypothetical protein
VRSRVLKSMLCRNGGRRLMEVRMKMVMKRTALELGIPVTTALIIGEVENNLQSLLCNSIMNRIY